MNLFPLENIFKQFLADFNYLTVTIEFYLWFVNVKCVKKRRDSSLNGYIYCLFFKRKKRKHAELPLLILPTMYKILYLYR